MTDSMVEHFAAREHRRDRSDFISSSMSEGERASSISADYPLSLLLARARFCPDIRKILENSVSPFRHAYPKLSTATGEIRAWVTNA
jgi:hypothetical protein